MVQFSHSHLLIVLSIIYVVSPSYAQEVIETEHDLGPECLAINNFFANEVWAKVGERTCLKCHNTKGDASDSEFLLLDTTSNPSNREKAIRHNHAAFQRVASAKENGTSLLLSKISGGLDHGGGEVFKSDSTEYRILKRYVRRASGLPDEGPEVTEYDALPLFDEIVMMSPRRYF